MIQQHKILLEILGRSILIVIWCCTGKCKKLIFKSMKVKHGLYCRSYCLLNMFRASPCPSSGAQEYYTVVAACGILCCGFSGSWSGVELRVMHPANRTHNPQLHTRPSTWKTTAQNTTCSNHCIILLSSWWWAWWCPKHVEQAIRSAIKTCAKYLY